MLQKYNFNYPKKNTYEGFCNFPYKFMLDSTAHNICSSNYFVRIFIHDFNDALLSIDFHPNLFYNTNTYATLRTDEIYMYYTKLIS